MAIAETNFETDAILSIAVTGSGRLFVANLLGLRTRDTDSSRWTPVLPRKEDPPFAVTAIEISQDGKISVGIPGGFGLSQDEGKSWSFAALPDPVPVITSIAIAPNSQLMLAGSEQDGVFRSVDGGQSWRAWNFGLLDASVLSIAAAGDNSIYAGTSTGLFVSRNEGRSWSPVEFPFDFDAILSLAVQGQLIHAGTESNGLWISRNLGASWSKCADVSDSTIPIIVTDDDATVIVLGESGLWFSADEGAAWSTAVSKDDIEITALSNPISVNGIFGVYLGAVDGAVLFWPLLMPNTLRHVDERYVAVHCGGGVR